MIDNLLVKHDELSRRDLRQRNLVKLQNQMISHKTKYKELKPKINILVEPEIENQGDFRHPKQERLQKLRNITKQKALKSLIEFRDQMIEHGTSSANKKNYPQIEKISPL